MTPDCDWAEKYCLNNVGSVARVTQSAQGNGPDKNGEMSRRSSFYIVTVEICEVSAEFNQTKKCKLTDIHQ